MRAVVISYGCTFRYQGRRCGFETCINFVNLDLVVMSNKPITCEKEEAKGGINGRMSTIVFRVCF